MGIEDIPWVIGFLVVGYFIDLFVNNNFKNKK